MIALRSPGQNEPEGPAALSLPPLPRRASFAYVDLLPNDGIWLTLGVGKDAFREVYHLVGSKWEPITDPDTLEWFDKHPGTFEIEYRIHLPELGT